MNQSMNLKQNTFLQQKQLFTVHNHAKHYKVPPVFVIMKFGKLLITEAIVAKYYSKCVVYHKSLHQNVLLNRGQCLFESSANQGIYGKSIMPFQL